MGDCDGAVRQGLEWPFPDGGLPALLGPFLHPFRNSPDVPVVGFLSVGPIGRRRSAFGLDDDLAARWPTHTICPIDDKSHAAGEGDLGLDLHTPIKPILAGVGGVRAPALEVREGLWRPGGLWRRPGNVRTPERKVVRAAVYACLEERPHGQGESRRGDHTPLLYAEHASAPALGGHGDGLQRGARAVRHSV